MGCRPAAVGQPAATERTRGLQHNLDLRLASTKVVGPPPRCLVLFRNSSSDSILVMHLTTRTASGQVERDPGWLDGLNPQQVEAVTHGDGPLLIVAGAGTGKTRTLAHRVAYLLSKGIRPEGILLLTFTRRAAREMLKRAVAAAPSPVSAKGVWGGTFHAVGNRLLRIHCASIGLSEDFTIMDRADAEGLLDVVRNDLSLASTDGRFPRKSTCLEIYSRRVNGDEALNTVLKRYFPWCEPWQQELKDLFLAYVERKQRLNVLDYDDLLLYWRFLVEEHQVAEAIEGRFDHILVDEYQDTNKTQALILEGMRRSNQNITVVGDDAQSIYSFRSATVENMLEFPDRFGGTKVVRLEQNYRSTAPILSTTNRLIAQSSRGYSKELWCEQSGGQRPQLITCSDENDQDDTVIENVLRHYEQGIRLNQQAVLFRASSHSTSLELTLNRKNIPYHKYGGLRFLESTHVKDLICILRVVVNPRDEVAWFRVLQLLKGVGPAGASSAVRHLAENRFDPSAIDTFAFPPSATEGAAELATLLHDIHEVNQLGPSAQIDRVLLFYTPILERTHDNPGPRIADLDHLAQLATSAESTHQFLADLVLDPPTSTGDLAGPPVLDEDWLVLSTIHSAKGLEWDVVQIIHAADGCLPSDMATGSTGEIDEELRLTYVATTRAREFLYVLWPLRYFHRPAMVSDSHSYAQRSRFLTEDVVASMDCSGPPEAPPIAPKHVRICGHVDIRSRLKGLWE